MNSECVGKHRLCPAVPVVGRVSPQFLTSGILGMSQRDFIATLSGNLGITGKTHV